MSEDIDMELFTERASIPRSQKVLQAVTVDALKLTEKDPVKLEDISGRLALYLFGNLNYVFYQFYLFILLLFFCRYF